MGLRKEVRDALGQAHVKIEKGFKSNKFNRNLMIIVPAIFALWLVPFNPLPLGLIILALTGSIAGLGTLIFELANYNLYKKNIPSAVSYREYKKMIRKHEIDNCVNDLDAKKLTEAKKEADARYPSEDKVDFKQMTLEQRTKEQAREEARIYKKIAKYGEADVNETNLLNKMALLKMYKSYAVEENDAMANRLVNAVESAIVKDPDEWTEAEKNAINLLK